MTLAGECSAGARVYPGETARPEDLRQLAEEYRRAAHHLLVLARRGEPLSFAPFRLSAIHSIELYLNFYLLRNGFSPADVRSLQHNLAARSELAVLKGLKLRRRTAAHLIVMTDTREYLVTRYGPELAATVSQTNRLTATLEEVASKTAAECSG